jgi:hypothetical protein
MKTLEQMMSNTPSDVVDRSRRTNAEVISVKSSRQRGVQTLVFVVRVQAHTEETYYDVVIELYPTEVHKDVFMKPSFKNPAWVHCSCPFFLFNCEYALVRNGSSDFLRHNSKTGKVPTFSNKKRPDVTNPKLVPYLCKHLYRASPEVVKKAVEKSANDPKYDFK